MPYNVKERQELVFAEVPICGGRWTYPMTADRIYDAFAGYASEILTDNTELAWSAICAHCAFDLIVYNEYTNEIVDRQLNRHFPTLASLVGHVNGLPNDGAAFSVDCVAKVYSVIDNSVPRINRLFGFNKFYSCLIGTAKAKKNRFSPVSFYEAFDPDHDLDDSNHTRAGFNFGLDHAAIEQFVSRAWTEIWGVTPGAGGFPAYNTNQWTRRDWLATIWFQTNKNKGLLYNLPATGVGLTVDINVDYGDERHVVDMSDTSSGDTVASGEHYLIEKFVICSIPIWDKISDLGTGNWHRNEGFMWHHPFTDTQAQWQGMDSSRSHVIIYGLQSGDRRALYIKPFGGVDTVCFPKIDTSLYRLEVVSSWPRLRDKFMPVDLTPFTNPGGGHYLMQYRVPRNAFWAGSGRTMDYAKRSNVDARHKFYLRRIGTEFVSPLSDVYIHTFFSPIGKRMSGITSLLETDR
jgi:hypothetical protein